MGLGLVLVYRGSGVLNFAQGAMGMIGAFAFYLWRDGGMPTPLAFVLAVALGVAIGVATHFLVMRPLRHAPALSRLIATLALFSVLFALGFELWGDTPRIVGKLLPTGTIEVLPDIDIGQDRLILFGVAVVLTAALSVVYRKTRFGLATSAVAENRRVPALLGISPDGVAAANWGLGSGLAVVAAILIVNVTGLNVANLTLLVVPGMAAALVGGFSSFALTLAGGLLIGVLESEIAYLQTKNVFDPADAAGLGPRRAVPRDHRSAHDPRAGPPAPQRGGGASLGDRERTGARRVRHTRNRDRLRRHRVRAADERHRGRDDDRNDGDHRAVARRRHRLHGPALTRAVRARGRGRMDGRPPRRELRPPLRARRVHRRARHDPRRARRRAAGTAHPRA